MPAWLKFLIGLAAALAAGWISHGPLGPRRGLRRPDRSPGQGAWSRFAALPGVDVRFSRDPLSREAIFSGPANDFQREGMGAVPRPQRPDHADSRASRACAGRANDAMPLLAETLILVALAYLLGIGLGWLFWGRRRDGFL